MEQYCWPMTIYDTGSCFMEQYRWLMANILDFYGKHSCL